MNTQRVQSYLTLIQQLLNSSKEQEEEILQANADLLDQGLIETVQKLARQTQELGDEHEANRLFDLLLSLAQKLATKQGVSLLITTQEEYEKYLVFLIEALERASKNHSPDSFQNFLLQNSTLLDEKLRYVLKFWATKTLPNLAPEEAQFTAAVIGEFSTLIHQFPLGDISSNLEIAITGYQLTLTIATYEAFPHEWAMTQHNLGAAYSDRIKGEKTDNLEQAIAAYKKALKVRTHEAFPCEWAQTHNNLGNAYYHRIRGDKAENIEQAIACYEEALTVWTLEAFPHQWAMLQNNLGLAYSDRVKDHKADNLERAIAAYEQALKIHEEHHSYEWARVKNNFGNAYHHRVRGDKAENIEQAITCYEEALTVWTLEAFPHQWAMLQNNLGLAYSDRVKGEKRESLEQAIVCYSKSLQIHTYEDFPYDWANIQNNLGNAYLNRIKGDKAENLEKAIIAYQEALRVRTIDALPYEWAKTQNNLGSAYHERVKGDKAENLEKAIIAYQEALRVRTIDALPYEWAKTQNNLGACYADQIQGDIAENLEQAIAAYQQALQVRTFENLPYDWAQTQHNLGNAYYRRIKGDKAENLEQAIAAYQQALQVRTFENLPYDWAQTQNNLGNVYLYRIAGDETENLEQAIVAYRQALQVLNLEAHPYEWAQTQSNLGVAYLYKIKDTTVENLEQAIDAFQQALRVRTIDSLPYEWAMTRNNLGLAYSKRVRGDKIDNLRDAISTYRQALQIYTPQKFPFECLETARNLGDVAFKNELWDVAIEGYQQAVEAAEQMRAWAINDIRRERIISESIDVYFSVVQAYVNTEQYTKAIEYVERSKARNLVELLAKRNLQPKGEVSDTILNEFNRLRQKINIEAKHLEIEERNFQLKQPQPQPIQIDRTRINQLQQEIDEFIIQNISPIDPSFSLTQKVEAISYEEIQSLTDDNTAIIEWYITNDIIFAFIITHKQPFLQVWQSSTEDWRNLDNWGTEYLRTYYMNRKQWTEDLETRLQNLAKTLHLDEIIAHIPAECNRLILVPHRFLHLLPLHALKIANQALDINNQTNRGSTYLLDIFAKGIQYAPSCQLLKLSKDRSQSNFHNLFAIQNPTEDLIYADLEVEIIRSLFPSEPQILSQQDATENAVKNHQTLSSIHCGHFACHGEFNIENPLESSLILANDERLTLGAIFELSLPICRLITLSACETGLTDFSSFSDEYIGLTNGFLLAGSPSVVSSLWVVNDLSTGFLMIRFYENLYQFPSRQPGEIGIALNQAQQWLRSLTIEDLEIFLEQHNPQIEKVLTQWRKGQRLRFEESLKSIRQRHPRPFESSYYWAAFTAIGL